LFRRIDCPAFCQLFIGRSRVDYLVEQNNISLMPNSRLDLAHVLQARSGRRGSRPELLESALQRILSEEPTRLGLGSIEWVDTEFPVDSGRIDILAKTNSGQYWVVELKGIEGTREHVGQLQAYVGDLMLRYPTSVVRGLLVAAGADHGANAAIRGNPERLFLSTYEPNVVLQPIIRPTAEVPPQNTASPGITAPPRSSNIREVPGEPIPKFWCVACGRSTRAERFKDGVRCTECGSSRADL
jgi:hypothetical protein